MAQEDLRDVLLWQGDPLADPALRVPPLGRSAPSVAAPPPAQQSQQPMSEATQQQAFGDVTPAAGDSLGPTLRPHRTDDGVDSRPGLDPGSPSEVRGLPELPT